MGPLETAPGKNDNWVESVGRLPHYIERIAVHLRDNGHSTGTAIAMAISTVKRWAAGGNNVKPDTVAKAAKAVAQWEALKAKSHAKSAAKSVSLTGETLNLTFADPGYLQDQKPRYATDSQEQVAWALSHLSQESNQVGYTEDQLSRIIQTLTLAVTDSCDCEVCSMEHTPDMMDLTDEEDQAMQDMMAKADIEFVDAG